MQFTIGIVFLHLVCEFVGRTTLPKFESTKLPSEVFSQIADQCDSMYNEVVQYIRRLAFVPEPKDRYEWALTGYIDFLFPLLSSLKELSFFPSAPVYVLIDDADYLNLSQTRVLNSWVSTRTQGNVSLKISTQLRYKTLSTPSGLPIQSPHDFQSINIADIYTTKHRRYSKRVEKIVEKRLTKAKIICTPQNFFPPDQNQEQKIKEIADKIRSNWSKNSGGYRAGDDVLRYARPEYIRSLGGKSKSLPTYSYAGFENLVHISSGLIRYFLEPAAVMFDEQLSQNPNELVALISPTIQNGGDSG